LGTAREFDDYRAQITVTERPCPGLFDPSVTDILAAQHEGLHRLGRRLRIGNVVTHCGCCQTVSESRGHPDQVDLPSPIRPATEHVWRRYELVLKHQSSRSDQAVTRRFELHCDMTHALALASRIVQTGRLSNAMTSCAPAYDSQARRGRP